ncbi:butyrophilin subfamily 3 member A2-like [Chelonia mydas]|uniref:butyrophilin subfamily 3 member A2-like n=1 Tax=Chelonia mydas TaxID=8469 RepID=UPI0018A222A4|nr:butyrophilin subfamily 3 member A2-like [Chelonia mydas]
MSAENMEVGWSRSQDSAVVHLYRDGQDQYREQIPEYQGRTELFRDDIIDGRVSLRIRDIRPSDYGQYTCFFQSSVFYDEALLELQVADLGSDPVISVEGHQDGGIRMVCRSSGWNSQPEVQWRNLQGKILPSASEDISQEASGLFQTEIAIILTEESNQKVSCCVRNPRLDQERETAISIAEPFFPTVNPWMVALGVILALPAVLMALASYCFWRQGRAKENEVWECFSVRDAEGKLSVHYRSCPVPIKGSRHSHKPLLLELLASLDPWPQADTQDLRGFGFPASYAVSSNSPPA